MSKQGLGTTMFLALLVACSGGGDNTTPAATTATSASKAELAPTSSFAFTADDYGMMNPTYLSATRSTIGLVLRAAVASSMTDPEYRTVLRIDIENPEAVVAETVYSLGTGGGAPSFPGNVYFFNGHQSTLLQTTSGSIAFTSFGTSPGEVVAGSFAARVLDGSDSATPQGSYSVAATFTFTVDRDGAVVPVSLPVPAGALSIYNAKCASCHAPFDPAEEGVPDLALKGGRLDARFSAGAAGHREIVLQGAEITALKVLLNVN